MLGERMIQMNDSILYSKVVEGYVEQLRLVFPNASKEELEAYVRENVNLSDRIVQFDDEVNKTQESLLTLTEFLETENPIISGHGTIYRNHLSMKNLLASMFDFLLKERKVAKKEMFKHVNDEDKTTYKNLDLKQKTLKLLANSGYGATVEDNSIFYNKNFGSAITATGVMIITTAVVAFENFMSANFIFYKETDFLRYVKNIVSEHYQYPDIVEKDIPIEKVAEFMASKFKNEITYNAKDFPLMERIGQEGVDRMYSSINYQFVMSILSSLTQEQLNRIYYKNNIYEFMGNQKIADVFDLVIGKEFLDPNEPPEELLPDLNRLWDYLQEWVYYDYLSFHRYQRAENEKRRTVLIVDTDSNFLFLNPFFEYFLERYPDRIARVDKDKVSTVNIATLFLSRVIEKNYWTLTKSMNIPADKRKIINMKNEFFYKRLMNTRNKKSYAGSLIMQEGHMLEKIKHDIKGLAIRKVNVNKNVRTYFTEMLGRLILDSDEINIEEVFGEYKRLEDMIVKSFVNGELTYSTPAKVNEIESYVSPYSIQSVRGSIIWNALYPDNEIVMPTKVNNIKLKAETLADLVNVPKDVYDTLHRVIFSNPEMAKHGFKIISVPKDLEVLPDWIIPLIDIETMVKDNVKSGMIILESLGFKTLDILDSQFPTNILEF